MAFEARRDLHAHPDDFLARGPGYRLALSPTAATFQLTKTTKPSTGKRASERGNAVAKDTLKMQLVGADASAHAVQNALPTGHANYFLGSDRSKWRSEIPLYSRVQYQQVYKGIDLVYYGNQSQLEYDFLVRPGVDPKLIGMKFVGARKVRIASNGDLVLGLKQGEVRWHKPLTYQTIAGKKRMVASSFVLKKGRKVGFSLARYDTSRPLTIDPKLIYSQTFSGTPLIVNSLAVDNAGNTYIAGDFQNYIVGQKAPLGFPVTPGAFQTANHNAFVAKLNPTGTAFVYATYLGGSGYDQANSIAIDGQGNAYITGNAQSTDFPITPGAFQTVNHASTEDVDLGYNAIAFVTKLNPTGSALVYSTFLGGHTPAGRPDTGTQIKVDSQGSAYVAGNAASSDFPTTPGSVQPALPPGNYRNGFVTKLNPAGTALIYSTYLTGSQGSFCTGIALGSSGDAYVTGTATSSDFPTTSRAFQKTAPHSSQSTERGVSPGFVTHLNAAGTALLYSTYLGGSGIYGESVGGIAVDRGGNAYVAGSTSSLDFPTTPGVVQPYPPAVGDSNGGSFVTKLNPDGSGLVYSTYLTPDGLDTIAVDSAGNVCVTGIVVIGNYPTTVGALQRALPQSNVNGFLSRLNTTGTALLYSTLLPGGMIASTTSVDDRGIVTIGGQGFVSRFSAQPIFPDFNNDGSTDLLLRNQATGVIGAWFMNGSHVQGGVTFSQSPPATYRLVGTGDFKGDGSTTLVFQDMVDNRVIFWYTAGANNATITGGEVVYPTPAAGWKLVGVADFNKDGLSDLLFQNQKTDQIVIWKMKGPFYQGGNSLPPPPVIGWKAVGAGDFNGDGFADIVLQDQRTGDRTVYFMRGTSFFYAVKLEGNLAPGWRVVGVGDYNGDGMPDLLFQNPALPLAVVWYMRGISYSGGSTLSLIMPTDWNIVGPH